jgi:glycosyltransferase involved in cell wall biosynthesis
MNVAFVNFAAEWGGGEGWTLRTASGLAGRGHTVLLAGLPRVPLTERARCDNSLKTVTLTPSFDYDPRAILRLHSLFRRDAIEVVVVHHNRDVRTAGVAARLAGAAVVHRNGFPVIHNNARHRFTQRFVNRILTNSRRIEARYRGFRWLHDKPIDVVPNGTPFPDHPYPRDPSKFGFSEHDLVACFAGRLTVVKRLDDLFDVFARLPESSSWKLAVVGTGAELDRLTRRTSEDPALKDRVEMVGFREDAADLLGAADLAVLPSSDEGMPNALMEAMARGTAVAATPVGDVELLLDGGNAGWLIDVGNQDRWFDLLQELEASRDRLGQMAAAGIRRIESSFSMDSMLEGVERSLDAARFGS